MWVSIQRLGPHKVSQYWSKWLWDDWQRSTNPSVSKLFCPHKTDKCWNRHVRPVGVDNVSIMSTSLIPQSERCIITLLLPLLHPNTPIGGSYLKTLIFHSYSLFSQLFEKKKNLTFDWTSFWHTTRGVIEKPKGDEFEWTGDEVEWSCC